MHFEILVEDLSGKIALETIIPKIIGDEHSFRIIPYKGVGRIPKDLKHEADPRKRILLDRLPKLLQGYGKTFAGYPPSQPAVVVLVCDLDRKCLKEFRRELLAVWEQCDPQPETRFCVAIEECEAWLLGDIPAIKRAYPKAKDAILYAYCNDSICGTWEMLADAVHPGGSKKLLAEGWQQTGAEKSNWAKKITPYMDVENNNSPSFQYFRQKLLDLAADI